MSSAMPQRMSISPSCHRQVLLRFLIVSFPAPRFLCHRFREIFEKFFRRTLTDRPTTNFAHWVYQQIFWNPAEDSEKIRLFSSSTPDVRSGNPRCTQGISGNKHENWRCFRKKIAFFSSPPRCPSGLPPLHTGYICGQNRNPIEILEKIVTFHAAIPSCGWFRTQGISGDKSDIR